MKDDTTMHTTWFGVFLFKEGKVIHKRLFPKDPKELAESKMRRDRGDILPEERELADEVPGKLYVTSKRSTELGEFVGEYDLEVEPEDHSYDQELFGEMMQVLGKLKLKDTADAGEHLAKAVNTVQDLNETINLLTERLRDWYAVYFPEFVDRYKDDIAAIVFEHVTRDEISKALDLDIDSVGDEISVQQEAFYRRLAESIVSQKRFREELVEYIEDTMESNAPTICHLTGPRLGAELIAQAGSLKKLAMMPSSTIQTLGAEKSLFRHLKKGTPPPKHGYILQHPYVHGASKKNRGKVSRLLANKIAIAARIDHFGGEPAGERLKEELKEKLKGLK